MNVEIHDNSKEVSAAIQAALVRGLEKCGLVAERYAKKGCPVAEDHGGTLRDSITHVVDEEEPAVYKRLPPVGKICARQAPCRKILQEFSTVKNL